MAAHMCIGTTASPIISSDAVPAPSGQADKQPRQRLCRCRGCFVGEKRAGWGAEDTGGESVRHSGARVRFFPCADKGRPLCWKQSGGKRAGRRKMPAVKGGFFCCGVEVAVFADRPDRHFPDGAPVGLAARFPAVDGQPARFLKAEKRGVDVGNVLRSLHVHRRLRRLNRRAVPFAAAIQLSAAADVKRPKLFGKIFVVPHDAVLV